MIAWDENISDISENLIYAKHYNENLSDRTGNKDENIYKNAKMCLKEAIRLIEELQEDLENNYSSKEEQ